MAVRKGQTRVLIVMAVAIVGYIAFNRWRASRQKPQAAVALPAPAVEQAVPPPVAPAADKVHSSS